MMYSRKLLLSLLEIFFRKKSVFHALLYAIKSLNLIPGESCSDAVENRKKLLRTSYPILSIRNISNFKRPALLVLKSFLNKNAKDGAN